MLPASLERIESTLGPDDVVLDVGGWASPLARADWVIDLMAYETRGLYGEAPDPARERFSAETWVVRDLCARQPWPFDDDQFDFAVCSHTLEDLRDPIWVCSELGRVAKRGYVEVPSRLEEQGMGVIGEFAGWSHHRWLVDLDSGGLRFVFKPHALHANPAHHLSAAEAAALTESERVQTLFWEARLDASEEIFLSADELDAYLAELVARHRDALAARAPTATPRSRRPKLRRRR